MSGRIDDSTFGQIQNQCIRDAVRMQEDVGFAIVTDGEFRRGSYWGRFVERIEGFTIEPALFKFRDDTGHEVEFTAPYTAAKLRRRQPLALDEFLFLRDSTKVTPKITLPAPSTMHFFRCMDFADSAVYPTAELFFADLGRVFRDEIAELAEAGCRYVQLDEVALAQLCDPSIRNVVESAGQKADRLVDLYIDSINDAVSTAPADMRVGIHVCRGNFKGHYLAAGGYGFIAERFFGRAKASHFLLEYDTARAGDFSPLRFARDKGVVLGLISSKTPALESCDELKRRVEEAARFIDLDRLAVSPQCGFASTVAGNPLSERDQRQKLELVVETASRIWP